MTSVTAQELKEKGNQLFAVGNYNDAISCYTDAIVENPSVPVYHTNRALCYLKLKKWPLAILDCQQALLLDTKSVKGYFFLGHGYLEKQLYDEAVANYQQAFELAKEQNLNFGDDIAAALRSAKAKHWDALEEKRIQEEVELETYLKDLVIKEKKRQLSEVKTHDEDNEKEINVIEEAAEGRLGEIRELFSKIDDRRRKRDVPDHLCGKISFEIMRDPVITPSGITYDKKDIEQHLQRVGQFDPVTRGELQMHQLTPNLAMKEVIDDFLEENGWAEEY